MRSDYLNDHSEDGSRSSGAPQKLPLWVSFLVAAVIAYMIWKVFL